MEKNWKISISFQHHIIFYDRKKFLRSIPRVCAYIAEKQTIADGAQHNKTHLGLVYALPR
jgi:hypothetical protein